MDAPLVQTLGTGRGYDQGNFMAATRAARNGYKKNFGRSHQNTVSALICGTDTGEPIALPKLYPNNCIHRDALVSW